MGGRSSSRRKKIPSNFALFQILPDFKTPLVAPFQHPKYIIKKGKLKRKAKLQLPPPPISHFCLFSPSHSMLRNVFFFCQKNSFQTSNLNNRFLRILYVALTVKCLRAINESRCFFYIDLLLNDNDF
jgi:hypothetical protein